MSADAQERGSRVSARWRIVGWIVLTTLLALLAVTVTMRSFLMGQVSESANAAISQEFDEFRVFAQEGVDPTTAEPFTSLEPFMQRYLSGRPRPPVKPSLPWWVTRSCTRTTPVTIRGSCLPSTVHV